jgi:hypothetical protein
VLLRSRPLRRQDQTPACVTNDGKDETHARSATVRTSATEGVSNSITNLGLLTE